MPAVLPQEPLDFLPLMGSQLMRQAECIDEQNDFNRRIGFGRDPIECLKGENLAGLAVVQQGKVLKAET
jgi:hypothetical protein